jgi:hypothetical protein
VGLSARGSRNLTGQIERIDDSDVRAQVARQARRVTLKALVVAIPLTVITLALP